MIRIIDSSALSDGVEFKYYARDVGEITEAEIAPDGSTTIQTDLYRTGTVGAGDTDDADDVVVALSKLREGRELRHLGDSRGLDPAALAGTGAAKLVTVVGGTTDSADALGAYLVDTKSGAIGEARILVADLSEAAGGASVAVDVPGGMSLGLFLVRGAHEIGVDLEAYAYGGLRLVNLLEIRDANLADPLAVSVTDAKGNILPIQPLNALGADDGGNLLNPAGSLQAIGLASTAPGADGISLIGFEDRLNTSPDYDGDFNDAIVAVSDGPIAAETLRLLPLEAQGGRLGTAGDDRLAGGRGAGRLFGLGGDDPLCGGGGNDRLAGGAGDDRLNGGAGDDRFKGGDGADTFYFSAKAPGLDRAVDFDAREGDVLPLVKFGKGFGFDALDTNGDGHVGAGDAGVAVGGGVMTLELGAGVAIELAGVRSLGADAFAFIA